MRKYLFLLGEEVETRYETLQTNIKSKSNSYYDSYLSLLETTIKVFLNKQQIEYDPSKTCGYYLNNKQVKDFFEKIEVPTEVYNKLIDYTKKVNDHKHKKEKNVTRDAIINQLNVYYSFISAYLKYYHDIVTPPFNEKEYERLFDLYKKEKKDNDELIIKELQALKTEIKELKQSKPEKVYINDFINKHKEEKEKDREIINTIKNSKKEHFWYGSTKEFKILRKTTLVFNILLIVISLTGILLPLAPSKDSLVAIFDLPLFFSSIYMLVYVIKSKKKIQDIKLAKYSIMKHNYDFSLNVSLPQYKEKKIFYWVRRFSYFMRVANITLFSILISLDKYNVFCTIGIVVEVILLIVTICTIILHHKLFEEYGFFTIVYDKNTSKPIYVLNNLKRCFHTYEDFLIEYKIKT